MYFRSRPEKRFVRCQAPKVFPNIRARALHQMLKVVLLKHAVTISYHNLAVVFFALGTRNTYDTGKSQIETIAVGYFWSTSHLYFAFILWTHILRIHTFRNTFVFFASATFCPLVHSQLLSSHEEHQK